MTARTCGKPGCGVLSSPAMLILPVSRSWVFSRAARKVYTVCAFMAIVMYGVLVGTRAAQNFVGTRMLPPSTAAILMVILIPAVIATALLWVAMLYFWFGFDRSHWLARAFWFGALYFLAPVGPALYCFIVYRKWTRDDQARSE